MKGTMPMRRNWNGIIKGTLLSLALILVFSFPSYSTVVGRVEKAKGKVSILKKGSFRGIDYRKINGKVEVGDIVRTKRRSFADISFIDRTRVFLKEKSRLIVEKYIPGKEVTVSSPMGKVIYRVMKVTRGAYRVKTPTALIGVKGTELATIVDSGISVILVKKGRVEVVNPEFPHYRVVVNRNMATVVRPGKPPSRPAFVSKTVIEKVFSLKGTGKEKRNPETSKQPVKTPVVKKVLPGVTPTGQTFPAPAPAKTYAETVTQEKVQEIVQEETVSDSLEEKEEENEEIVTEVTTELITGNEKVKVNVSIPPTETPK